jgi:hypothetical protein
MLDENMRQTLRQDADLLRSTNRSGDADADRVEAFERLFKHLPSLVDELAEAERRIGHYETALDYWKRNYQRVADQLWESCVCDPNPETTEGMLADCPIHGTDEHRPLALKAAIERVRALHTPAAGTVCYACNGEAAPCSTIAALGAPGGDQADSTDQQATQHTDPHGRTWDPHPFVQSRAVDNVGVCICGQAPGHHIHSPAAGQTVVSVR